MDTVRKAILVGVPSVSKVAVIGTFASVALPSVWALAYISTIGG